MSKKTTLAAVAASFLFAMAGLAQAPPSTQSSGPTSNEYRMQVLEPVEGAVIQGTDFNVVLSTPGVPTGTSMSPAERKDSLRPVFQVFVDGKDMGNVPNDQNVFAVHTDTFGPHKLVVLSKNGTGQVIDRKEISISTTDVRSTTTQTRSRTIEAAPAPAPAAPPARIETRSTEPAPAPVAPPADSYTASSSTLPKTASDYPAAAVAGLALAGAGLWLRRRS